MNQRIYQFAVFYTFLASCFVIFGCASNEVSSDVPTWAKNEWRQEFPDSKFLSARGIATESEAAKTDALAQISQYIGTSINANLSTSVQTIEKNGVLDETFSIQNEVAIKSQVDLFGVEFTKPYFLKKEKQWYCVAYINRDKAWEQYVPHIEVAKKVFYGFYREAENESEPLLSCAYYKKSWEKGKDFLTQLEYGRLITPIREKEYSPDRNTLALIPSKIASEMNNILLQIEIEGDFGGIIETSLEKAFKKSGFTTAKNGNYKVFAQINPNATGKEPIAVFPGIDLKIQGTEGRTVYSYKDRVLEKTTGFSLETAQRKSYPKLAEKIEQNLPDDFSKIIEAK